MLKFIVLIQLAYKCLANFQILQCIIKIAASFFHVVIFNILTYLNTLVDV